jgi:hypothetical protein
MKMKCCNPGSWRRENAGRNPVAIFAGRGLPEHPGDDPTGRSKLHG